MKHPESKIDSAEFLLGKWEDIVRRQAERNCRHALTDDSKRATILCAQLMSTRCRTLQRNISTVNGKKCMPLGTSGGREKGSTSAKAKAPEWHRQHPDREVVEP